MAIKNDYTPFLKFKANEVAGLSVLDKSLKEQLSPFFDLPRRDGMDRAEFESVIKLCAGKVKRYLQDFPCFFVDTFDIPDDIAISGSPNCRPVIDSFGSLSYVPVLGLDRAWDHNQEIILAKFAGEIRSDAVAVRFQPDDFASFELIEGELDDLVATGSACFEEWIFIFDCRVCLTSNRSKLAADIAAFVAAAQARFGIRRFILVGSSIPATITDIARPQDESVIARAELEIFHAAKAALGDVSLSLGDYTIVSPLYSELNLPPEMLHSVMAPKVFYAFQNFHYIARGGRIKTNGYQQYNQIANEIVGKSFYRKPPYSWGDNFIQEKANGLPPNVTPSTILKPTICAHITYMAQDYPS